MYEHIKAKEARSSAHGYKRCADDSSKWIKESEITITAANSINADCYGYSAISNAKKSTKW